ncbi:MAG: substrate-binding domain-containing protein [Anaerolineae bacterium]
MSEKSYSRRSFLRLAATGAAASLLAACQPKVVEKVVKETVEVEKEVTSAAEQEPAPPGVKEVRILLSPWAVGEIPFDRTAREFNEANEDVEVKIDTTSEGWDTKVIAQINEGTLEWSGAGILTPFLVMQRWVETGMVQPMDDYIAASQQEGAGQVLSDMIDTIKEDGSYQGEFYSLAYSFENITYNWRVDYANEVGWDKAPETWDEWLEIALELKSWGADEQIYPTSFAESLWTDVGALICAAVDDTPYTDEGLIDWESDEMIESLAFYKKLIVEEELTPPHGSDGWLDAYYAGKVASVQAQSSRGVWGQNAFGTDKVSTSPIPTREPGGGVGSVYWGNGVAILNKAPYPQEATDYLIYTMGPQNTGFQKTVMQTGKTPIYHSAYDIIEQDPQFRVYEWMLDMVEDVENSIPAPRNNYYTIQNTVFQNHRVTFTEVGSEMTPEECAQLILEDSREEIEKQQL